MSFREKSTWVIGTIILAVYGWYFVVVFSQTDSRAITDIGYKGMLVGTVAILAILVIVSHILLAVTDPKGSEQNDERDREINRFGEYVGGFVLAAGSFIALFLAVVEADYFWIANAILLGLVLSELVASGTKIILYRRRM